MKASNDIIKVIDLIPGTVHPLDTIAAHRLNPDVFWHDYVCRHRPLLIKGGAASWPAVRLWGQAGYLESMAPEAEVALSRTYNPVPASSAIFNAMGRGPWRKCLEEMRLAPDDATYSIPAAPVPAAWEGDLGEYAFLAPGADRAPFLYPRRRLFIYRNASTEWHYHPTDETLTTQLSGTKQVSLFRLTPHNRDSYQPIISANLHHLACARRFFPHDSALSKYEGTLEPGDVAYIPPYWWHGIDPADASLGVTLAHCFRTPLARFGHWRDPITREMFPQHLWQGVRQAAVVAAWTSLSTAWRVLRRERWHNGTDC